MGPKQKKEVASGVVNWYEHVPKEMLDKADNPNFHLHHIN